MEISRPENAFLHSLQDKARATSEIRTTIAELSRVIDGKCDQRYSSTTNTSDKTAITNSSAPDLEKGTKLPNKQLHHIPRHARHTFFNVYRRLFALAFTANVVGIAVLLWRYRHDWSSPALVAKSADAAAANILIAILIRQDYVVNILFKATWLVPLTAPLRVRRILAKVYEYGGVHSGTSTSAVLWFALLTGSLTKHFTVHVQESEDIAVLALTYILLALLLAMVITAYPRFRFSSHNTFENVHRFGGWICLAVFWVELVLFTRTKHASTVLELVKLPASWFLLVSSLHAILPWLRLRKLPVEAERLSDHAIRLHFKETIPLFVGIRISSSPLKEWHSFACIPARAPQVGGSILISNAGDWTSHTIEHPKAWYWVKGVPVTGVLCMARIFRSIVVVTTGSGIGPVLAVVQDLNSGLSQCKIRVIWSTPDPIKTYGNDILTAVRNVDGKAIIWDTRKNGRPDLLSMAWGVYIEESAEAVFVISNPKLTRKVVYGLESRGVPSFGPIWDS